MIAQTLTHGYMEGEAADELPEGASLVAGKYKEWLLLLQDRPQDPSFSLTVSLADQLLCRHWAGLWDAKQSWIRAQILDILSTWKPETEEN